MHLCATNADGVWRRDHENEVTPRDENRGTWCSASRLLAGPSQAQSFYNQLLFIFNFHTTILNLFTLCGSRLHSTSPGSHTHTHTHHTHTHTDTQTHTHTPGLLRVPWLQATSSLVSYVTVKLVQTHISAPLPPPPIGVDRLRRVVYHHHLPCQVGDKIGAFQCAHQI